MASRKQTAYGLYQLMQMSHNEHVVNDSQAKGAMAAKGLLYI